MYQSQTGLPHLLKATDYTDPAIYQSELQQLLKPAWHLVGTQSQLESDGQFITCQLLGHEIYLHNFGGQIRAFVNSCAHRHCQIQSAPSGKLDAMRCQYHGWEYGEDGLTRKIPCSKEFAPLDRSQLQLPSYRVDLCGQLVFICVEKTGPSLRDFLGEAFPIIESRFSLDMSENYRKQFTYQANWKVALENSLEAYHVEAVHPETFRNSPGEARSDHYLTDRYTSFTTDMPFASSSQIDLAFQKAEGWIVKRLGQNPLRRYSQHHVFPNLLFSCTDAISLVHSVRPISVDQSESTCIQFGLAPREATFIQKGLSRMLGRIEALLIDRILQEDVQMYSKIQRGLAVSTHRGMLARSEERIHSFHQFIKSFS